MLFLRISVGSRARFSPHSLFLKTKYRLDSYLQYLLHREISAFELHTKYKLQGGFFSKSLKCPSTDHAFSEKLVTQTLHETRKEIRHLVPYRNSLLPTSFLIFCGTVMEIFYSCCKPLRSGLPL